MNAGVAQRTEHNFSKITDMGSNPVTRFVFVKVKTRILYLLTLFLWAPPAQEKYSGNTDPLAAINFSKSDRRGKENQSRQTLM